MRRKRNNNISRDKKNVIIYCRVSSDEQKKGSSLEVQEERLVRECQRRGYNIIDIPHWEDESGKTFVKRPVITNILQYIKKHSNEVDMLLCLRWNRFSRVVSQGTHVVEDLKDNYGVEVNAIEEHIDYIKLHKYFPEYVSDYKNCYIEGNTFYDTVEIMIDNWIQNGNEKSVSSAYLRLNKAYSDDNDREHALEMLLRRIYIDLSGLTGYTYFSLFLEQSCSSKKLKELFSEIVYINTDDILSVVKYKDIYNDSIVHNIYKQELPIQICDEQLFIYIINSMLDGTYNEDIVQRKLKKAFNKTIDDILQQRNADILASENVNVINKVPWYKKIGWIIVSLILLYPLGLFLMWKYTDWTPKTKKIASIAFGIWYVLALIIGS